MLAIGRLPFGAAQGAGLYAFDLADYLRVKDTPDADVPPYGVGPDDKPTSTPAPARVKAHTSGEGSLVITVDGARYRQVF